MRSNPTRPDPSRPDPNDGQLISFNFIDLNFIAFQPDPSRPVPTRPDPTRPDPSRPEFQFHLTLKTSRTSEMHSPLKRVSYQLTRRHQNRLNVNSFKDNLNGSGQRKSMVLLDATVLRSQRTGPVEPAHRRRRCLL